MKAHQIIFAIIGLVLLGCSATNPQPEPNETPSLDKDVVVLLHGLGRSNSAMWLLASRLEDAGFKVERVGYGSLTQTPEQILESVTQQIELCCAQLSSTVHFVGHSLGGLMVRAYLQDHEVRHLGCVVLMGAPNQGSEIVDKFRDTWWMQFAGPTALALGTDKGSFPKSLQDPYYPVGVIAGASGHDTNDEILPGLDDGLVRVESTKLNDMTDFIIIETGHSMMRYNEDVAKQTIAFLKYGKFDREQMDDINK